MPARGEKFEFTSVRVLKEEFQSVCLATSADPIINSVFVKATTPVMTMKIISTKTKITPIEPTFMKMLRSFLLQSVTRAKNRAVEQ